MKPRNDHKINVAPVVRVLLRNIRHWSKTQRRKIVICVDGYSGAGKTSLANNLPKREYVVLHLDDFMRTRSSISKKPIRRLRKVGDLCQAIYRTNELLRIVAQFRHHASGVAVRMFNPATGRYAAPKWIPFNKSAMIIEGVFLGSATWMLGVFDYKVFLRSAYGEAAGRRTTRDDSRWGVARRRRGFSIAEYVAARHRDYVREEKPDRRSDLVISVLDGKGGVKCLIVNHDDDSAVEALGYCNNLLAR